MAESEADKVIQEIASAIWKQREQGEPLAIVLGSQAGEFYKNSAFYKELEYWIPGFQEFSECNKFKRCYEVLNSYHSEQAIDDILSLAAKAFPRREADGLLAKLVQAQFVNTLIITHIGTALEDAIAETLKEPHYYEPIIPALAPNNKDIYRPHSRTSYRLFKIFGDLESHRYKTAERAFTLESDPALKEFLEAEFQKNVVLIGYNPAWDRAIEPAFLASEKILWYVNEEAPPPHSQLAHMLQQRQCNYVIGPQGEYSAFIAALSEQLGRMPLTRVSGSPRVPGASPERTNAFISYSHTDSRHLDRFEVHLKGFLSDDSLQNQKRNPLNIWSDRRIQKGDLWRKEIEDALANTKVAVLLVSADFLASKYIRNYELPILLQAAKEGKVVLLSFVLSPCNIKETELANYQVVNTMDGTFLNLSRFKREALWHKLAQQVFSVLRVV